MSQYCYFLQICYEFKMRAFNQDGLYFFWFLKFVSVYVLHVKQNMKNNALKF